MEYIFWRKQNQFRTKCDYNICRYFSMCLYIARHSNRIWIELNVLLYYVDSYQLIRSSFLIGFLLFFTFTVIFNCVRFLEFLLWVEYIPKPHPIKSQRFDFICSQRNPSKWFVCSVGGSRAEFLCFLHSQSSGLEIPNPIFGETDVIGDFHKPQTSYYRIDQILNSNDVNVRSPYYEHAVMHEKLNIKWMVDDGFLTFIAHLAICLVKLTQNSINH